MNLDGVFLILCALIVAVIFARKARASVHRDDFEYLTVREQLAIANNTADTIAELEQLCTDMECSDKDDVMILHLEWIGRDNEAHALDLACDGTNTCTEDMIEISECEINDLKNDLSHQLAILSGDGRSRRNSRQNNRLAEGGKSIAEIVSALRAAHLNG